MAERAVAQGEATNEDARTERSKRSVTRSTIQFPYMDLNEAITVAKVVHDRFGGECSLRQMAAAMGQTTSSGAYRLKLSNGRMFGVIELGEGKILLTELGRRIIDRAQEKGARVQAFLSVPLFKILYEKYKDYKLPPPVALENVMVGLGVSAKQSGKARQAFQRSAEQAGFFAFGKDRLVLPTAGPVEPGQPSGTQGTEGASGDRASPSLGGGDSQSPFPPKRHPAIEGLLDELPARGAPWTSDELDDWIETLRGVLRVVYKVKGRRAHGEA